MATITIQNPYLGLKGCLRDRAAKNGHSMEDEASEIFRKVDARPSPNESLAVNLSQVWALGGVAPLPVQRELGPATDEPDEPPCIVRLGSRSGLCISAILNSRGC